MSRIFYAFASIYTYIVLFLQKWNQTFLVSFLLLWQNTQVSEVSVCGDLALLLSAYDGQNIMERNAWW
jgi:hypothetical protein